MAGVGGKSEEVIIDLMNKEVEILRIDDNILFMKELKNEIESFCYNLRDIASKPGSDVSEEDRA